MSRLALYPSIQLYTTFETSAHHFRKLSLHSWCHFPCSLGPMAIRNVSLALLVLLVTFAGTLKPVLAARGDGLAYKGGDGGGSGLCYDSRRKVSLCTLRDHVCAVTCNAGCNCKNKDCYAQDWICGTAIVRIPNVCLKGPSMFGNCRAETIDPCIGALQMDACTNVPTCARPVIESHCRAICPNCDRY
jgi:hypothetical protein